MDNEPWQRRLREVGISQADFAALVGLTPTNLSEGLRGRWKTGVPAYLKAIIVALEVMSPEQRADWVQRRKSDTPKPR
jgi:transcriptional regulator with XRE-family HTH domain